MLLQISFFTLTWMGVCGKDWSIENVYSLKKLTAKAPLERWQHLWTGMTRLVQPGVTSGGFIPLGKKEPEQEIENETHSITEAHPPPQHPHNPGGDTNPVGQSCTNPTEYPLVRDSLEILKTKNTHLLLLKARFPWSSRPVGEKKHSL